MSCQSTTKWSFSRTVLDTAYFNWCTHIQKDWMFSFQDTVVLFQKLKLKSHDTETMFQKKLEVNGRKQSTLYLKMQCQKCQRKSCFKAETLPKIKTCEWTRQTLWATFDLCLTETLSPKRPVGFWTNGVASEKCFDVRMLNFWHKAFYQQQQMS